MNCCLVKYKDHIIIIYYNIVIISQLIEHLLPRLFQCAKEMLDLK